MISSNNEVCEAVYYCKEGGANIFSLLCPAGSKCVPCLNFQVDSLCLKEYYQPNEIKS